MPETSGSLDQQLLDIMLRTGSRWVLWLLLALSLAAVALILERIWFYVTERRMRVQIAAAMAALRTQGPLAGLAKLEGARSMEATVARVSMVHANEGAAAVEEH